MSTDKLSNISLSNFRKFLENAGCMHIRTEGGHEIWSKKGLKRAIIVQTHKKIVAEFIVKNTIRNLEINRDDFFKMLK